MTEQRRYDEDEIREIFGAAAKTRDSGVPAHSSGAGLTLADLQAIGLEVGLPVDRISAAALALDRRRATPPLRTYLGMPISVGRTVDLPRAPTDDEWELLVAELRETFRARGTVGSHGGLRDWRNGNLHAYVERTETGHRLRLVTLKGDAVPITRAAISLAVLGVMVLIVQVLTGKLAEGLFAPVMLAVLGGAVMGSAIFRLPRWAKERREQMGYIAARAQALIGSASEADANGGQER